MKKQFFILASSVLALGAQASDGMPTWYGLVNKEIRYISQDKKAAAPTYSGVTDVDGFESRLGIKGDYNETSIGNVHYKFELGINSNLNSGTDRIRIRLGHVDVKNSWGTVRLGQFWTPGSLAILAADPWMATGSQLFAPDNDDLAGSKSANGARGNGFKDQVAFISPEIAGATITVTHWKSNGGVQQGDKWYEFDLNYKNQLGSIDFGLFGTFAKQEMDSTKGSPLESFWNAGLSLSQKDWMVSFVYGTEDKGKISGKDYEYTNMMIGAKYMFTETLGLLANYGSTDFGKEGVGNSQNDGEQVQFSVGLKSDVNKFISHRVMYRNTKIETKDGISSNTAFTKNTANAVIYGMTLKF